MVFEFSLSFSNGEVQNSPFIFPHNTYDYFYVSNHSGGRGRNENTESESKYVCLYIMAGMLYMYYILCMIYAMHLKMEAFFFILWLWVFRLCALCVRYFLFFLVLFVWNCQIEMSEIQWNHMGIHHYHIWVGNIANFIWVILIISCYKPLWNLEIQWFLWLFTFECFNLIWSDTNAMPMEYFLCVVVVRAWICDFNLILLLHVLKHNDSFFRDDLFACLPV